MALGKEDLFWIISSLQKGPRETQNPNGDNEPFRFGRTSLAWEKNKQRDREANKLVKFKKLKKEVGCEQLRKVEESKVYGDGKHMKQQVVDRKFGF